MTKTEMSTADAVSATGSTTADVLRQLAAVAAGGRPGSPTTVLSDRADGLVVRVGESVAKAHAPGTDLGHLLIRLRVAAHPLLRQVLLPPMSVGDGDHGPLVDTFADGRAVSRWPYGVPVDPDAPEAAPWAAAGALLAQLHSTPTSQLPGPLPPMGGPRSAARAVARMRRTTALRSLEDTAVAVERAWRALPPWARDEAMPPGPRTLCHGDWHLGQLVRHPATEGCWQMIDVDDLGVGQPSWDLARPAAWYASGLLMPQEWEQFLRGYRSVGGPAVAEEGDPWRSLDVPARALTVQTAALGVAKARMAGRTLDEAEQAMVDCCARMTP